eukprot:353064-Chlamydomonas_euryale.AAC.3
MAMSTALRRTVMPAAYTRNKIVAKPSLADEAPTTYASYDASPYMNLWGKCGGSVGVGGGGQGYSSGSGGGKTKGAATLCGVCASVLYVCSIKAGDRPEEYACRATGWLPTPLAFLPSCFLLQSAVEYFGLQKAQCV